jgi:hypothetical protein
LPDIINPIYFFQIVAFSRLSGQWSVFDCGTIKVTLGGHSALDPPLPIPNRVVKRSRADDSMHSYAKVGHCQAPHKKSPARLSRGFFVVSRIPYAVGSVVSRNLRQFSNVYGYPIVATPQIIMARLNNSSASFVPRGCFMAKVAKRSANSHRGRFGSLPQTRYHHAPVDFESPSVDLARKEIEAGRFN